MSQRERFIYIGPNVPIMGLKRNTIYKDAALPEGLERVAATKPVVRALYVSADGLAIAVRNLNKKGSLEHHANNEMLSVAKTRSQ
jgi:hypothetical protein